MENDISRRSFLKGAAAGALGAVATGFLGISAIDKIKLKNGKYTPGIYSASATGIGKVTVTMTFSETAITNVKIDTSNETEGIGKGIGDQFAEKLIKAQSQNVDTISGATVTSNAIKTAAAACIAQAMGGTIQTDTKIAVMKGYSSNINWLGDAPVVNDKDIDTTINADVVVVGSGHAGIQVALAAAQKGASVAVIEKQTEDKFTVLGEDVGIWNSKFMQDTFNLEEYDVGEIVHEFVRRSGGRVNANLIHTYVENSGRMFDNAIKIIQKGAHTDILDTSVLVCQKQKGVRHYPIECGGWKTWATTAQFMGKISHESVQGVAKFSNLPVYSKELIREAQRLGAKWYYGTSAVVLDKDSEGTVTGCISKDSTGKYIRFAAKKGVAVTTGDFAANSDMSWALLNEEMEWGDRKGEKQSDFLTPFSRDGYGHKLCCWAGGMIEPSPRPTMNIGGSPGGPWGTAPFLWLNKSGLRYCNEASIQSVRGITMRQPAGLIVTVTDSKWMQSVCSAGVEHGGPNYGRPVYYDEMEDDMSKVLAAGSNGSQVRGCFIAERMESTVYGANTLSELAEYLGYSGNDKSTFLASIEHYNKLCYKKDDTDFGKDIKCMIPVDHAPFYGVIGNNSASGAVGLVTLAGMVTDNNMNVLDENYSPIKGLYVAGNTLGGRYGTGYCTPCAGNSIGMAETHGYVLGEYLASL